MANALSGSPVSYRRNALGDYRAQGNGRSPMSAVNALQALSMIPGVGDFIGPVADAAMYYDKPETRTPGNFALSTLGLLPFVPGMTVFHGSPHKFDAFDISKIGTGEGAQAYGHGLYFAEAPDVAKSYATGGGGFIPVQGKDNVYFDGEWLRAFDDKKSAEGLAKYAMTQSVTGTSIAEKVSKLAKMGRADAAEWLQENASRFKVGSGNMYTVDIPDEAVAKMLDWDAPLSEQPDIVNALRGKVPESFLKPDMTGSDLYARASGLPAGDVFNARESGYKGSELLRSFGIPGIKYLDQGSRASGQGTRNFVVFDDKLAKILKRE